MKKALIALFLSSILLLGCAKPKPVIIYETREVEIPTYQIPKFELPNRPVLPIELLSEEDRGNHNTIGKAYVKTTKVLSIWSDQLYNLLEGIKKGSIE